MGQSDVTILEIVNHVYAKHSDMLENHLGKSLISTLQAFPAYSPNNTGDYKGRSDFTIQAIQQIFPAINQLATYLQGVTLELKPVESFAKTDEDRQVAEAIKVLFDQYGSDKSTLHKYQYFYGPILQQKDKVKLVFEIGLGTNNTDVVGNMGAQGKPGASLRAFRDWCPNAKVFGADIDARVLFSEERIETFHVDQTNTVTLDALLAKAPAGFDLVIDDGLHSPFANINTLKFGLELVRPGGWVVIEDISRHALSIWQMVASLFPKQAYECHLLQDGVAFLFAIKKL